MLSDANEPKIMLSQFLSQKNEDKIPALPLQFEYFPVQVLSKQFTKLNSNHPYRVHYLGPRPLNTLIMHKRYSYREDKPQQRSNQDELKQILYFKPYRVNLKKIVNCNFTNERLQQNNHYKSAIFYRAFQGMNPTLPLQHELIFNSAFENGNLDCVIKIKPNQYDLFLRIDSNTRGHTSWYYFSINNKYRLDTITLNICNLTKPNLLYQQGMRPFIFSKKAWIQKQKSWGQQCQCKFQQSNLRYDIAYESGNIPVTYRLTFDYKFQFQDDEVFFAYCIPYTYSELQHDIQNYQKSNYVRKDIIGKSLSGLDLPVLHITNHQYNQKKKRNIIISGRVHPGQANSSHMLKGFINFLLSQTKETEELRNNANFFIIPMLNPDGVILGNTRASIVGRDLNREFMGTKKQLYPEVFNIKNFTAKIHRKYGVFMYIDFHGHSRRKNTFLYGPNYPISSSNYYKCRILPKIIEKYDPKFRFYSCSFNISEEKKTTARAIMLNQLKIPFSYTIQSSIGLFYNPLTMKTMYFYKQTWQQMGNTIGLGVNSFIIAFIEYELYIKDRKFQRLKLKQQKELKSSQKLGKFKQDDPDFFSKIKKTGTFLELLEQVKVASENFKNFQQEAESDDHDEKEDFVGYKLIQFNNMITKGVQRQKNHNKGAKVQQQIDFQTINFPSQFEQQEQQQIFDNKVALQESPSPQKKMSSTLKYPRTEDSKRKNQISTQFIGVNKHLEVQSKKNIQIQQKQKIFESKQKLTKNFVLKNKERYSIATKNLFPIEDKCQILSLPRSIQIMRKSMKKGRQLINNLEQSRLKFHIGAKSEEKRQYSSKKQTRTPFLQIKSGASGINLAAQNINLNDFRIRKSQSHFHELDPYSTFNGFEVDNRAMTITTFKNMK